MTLPITPKIKGIYGPVVEGDERVGATVGHNQVTQIEMREQDLGSYGIIWFDVFRGDKLWMSLNGMMTAQVDYFED